MLDVAREENDAAEIELAGQRPNLVGHRVTFEAGDGELADMTANIAQRHKSDDIALPNV
jgi:hypothetical protein